MLYIQVYECTDVYINTIVYHIKHSMLVRGKCVRVCKERGLIAYVWVMRGVRGYLSMCRHACTCVCGSIYTCIVMYCAYVSFICKRVCVCVCCVHAYYLFTFLIACTDDIICMYGYGGSTFCDCVWKVVWGDDYLG